ncbi:inorganic phosphate transporter [Desulfovibrio sp. OttesenSCG-928-C14]|nr:inorganic phosphate transporter [Desulfovibrio sp. OttesenSCG-928-C14]
MDIVTIVLALSIAAGFLMAFSLGANDVANSMAAAVGAKAVTIRQAVVIAAVLNCVGSIFLGAEVASTISRGIINPDVIDDHFLLMLGMFAALLSSGLWVLIATLTGLPVSSTHSIVGSILGLGLVLGGPDVVQWKVMIGIVLAWILSPFTGAVISYFIFVHIRRTILWSRDMLKGALRWMPFWLGLTLVLIFLSLLYKTPMGKKWDLGWGVGLLCAAAIMGLVLILGKKLFPALIRKNQRKNPDDSKEEQVDGMFRRMQLCTSCYVALSQGANDVANAIGPVAAIYLIAREHRLTSAVEVPLWLLILGGAGIALGIFFLGHKVMATVGERITKMNNSRGFAVAFGAATTVLMASNLGMPVSTTHASVGSVVGVGLARGFAAVDFRVLGKIVLYWVLTVPIAAFSCILIFTLLRWTFT